jgi:mannose-6-phosphate isomerase-like protein (cupin superfamily)
MKAMPAAPFHARIAEMPRESIAAGALTRTAVRTDDAIVTFNWIEPGHPEVPPHSHPYDQLALILAGALELNLDGDKYTVRAGELLYIPARVPHVGRVVGDEVVLNVDIFAPIREDYLYLAAHQDGKEGSAQ